MGTFLFELLCMMVCYCILMVIIGKMDPVPFVRKYAPYMLQVFSMASSNASIPLLRTSHRMTKQCEVSYSTQ